MTKKEGFLIRKFARYVEPKNTIRALYIAVIILLGIALVCRIAPIIYLSVILIICCIVARILLYLLDVLAETIKRRIHDLKRNRLIYVLLSDTLFLFEYVFCLIILPILSAITIIYQLNFLSTVKLTAIIIILAIIVVAITTRVIQKKLLN